MFLGKYKNTVDNKGRLNLPKEFRQKLGKCLIIVNSIFGTNRCLDAFPVGEWASIEKAMSQKPRLNNRSKFQIYYLSGAFECAIDDGRVTIPKTLREYAGIEENVVLGAAGSKFRIWDQGAWINVFKEKP